MNDKQLAEFGLSQLAKLRNFCRQSGVSLFKDGEKELLVKVLVGNQEGLAKSLGNSEWRRHRLLNNKQAGRLRRKGGRLSGKCSASPSLGKWRRC